MKYFVLIILGIVILNNRIIAQETNECISEVLAYEEEIYAKKYLDKEKASFIHYKVKSEDWDGKIVSSEVKVYRDATNVHFFSDQANIYIDSEDMYLVLKPQKVVIANTTPEEIKKNGYSDDFLELRKRFLADCEVVECKFENGSETVKILKLKVNEELEGIIDIETMTYRYDIKQKNILSTTVTYYDDYQVKKLTISYLKFNPSISYKFKKSRKYVFYKQDYFIAEFKGYEYVDDRNK